MIRNDTHEVRIDRERGLVVKRFRSARRGEPVREWTALSLLDRLAPGLAPAPVSADLDSDFPVVTMSLLPGAELSAAPVTPAQARALAEALERLWRSVPSVGRELPAVTPNPVAFARQVTAMLAARPGLPRRRAACLCPTRDFLRHSESRKSRISAFTSAACVQRMACGPAGTTARRASASRATAWSSAASGAI